MKISTILENCKSIKDVVKLINTGGTSDFTANEIAAQYAYEACENKDPTLCVDKNDFMCHLDYLHEMGALFNSAKAEEHAKGYLI